MVKRGQLRINPAASAYQILADKRTVNEIFDEYNANLPEGNRVDFGGSPDSKVSQMKGVVCQALDIILMCGNDHCYMDAAKVKSVAQILNRPILLINADSSASVELGKVDSCTLYNPDGSVKTFQIDRSGKVFDRGTNASPVFPENAIVIAKNAMHFYGQPSFGQNGLHVLAEGLKKPVRNFGDLGMNFENQGAEDASVAPDILRADVLSPEDAALEAQHRLIGIIALLTLAAGIYSVRHPGFIANTLKNWTAIVVSIFSLNSVW
jgi:hypothetical protein